MPRRALAAFLAVGLTLAACTGDDDEGPDRGGTLRVAVSDALVLDPAAAGDRSQATVADLVFDGLVALDAETAEPVAALASDWDVTADQRRFTFTLAEDARFHDGEAVTATDVKASWERLVAPRTDSAAADLLAPVEGFDAARDGAGQLSGVRTPDDRTIVVELTTPLSDFVLNLTHPALGVLPDGKVQPPRTPVGSGPFSVNRREQGTVTLERAAESDALVDRIDLRLVDSNETAATTVADRDADIALLEGRTEAPSETAVVSSPYLAVGYYALNLHNPKLADERFRSAIALAIDGEDVVAAAYGETAATARSIVPSGVVGADTRVCDDRCGPDRDRAEQLLRQVFADREPTALFLDHEDTTAQRRVARAIERQLAAVGITAEARPHPVDEYDDFLANGDPDLFGFGWVGQAPAPRSFLRPVFVPDAPENVIGIDPPELVPSLTAAAEATSSEARVDAYEEAQEAVMAQWAVIPLAQFTSRYATAPAVQDLVVSIFGTFDGTRVWVEET